MLRVRITHKAPPPHPTNSFSDKPGPGRNGRKRPVRYPRCLPAPITQNKRRFRPPHPGPSSLIIQGLDTRTVIYYCSPMPRERRFSITISISPGFSALLERKKLNDPQFNASRFIEACVFASAEAPANSLDPDFQRLSLELEKFEVALTPEALRQLATRLGLDQIKTFYKLANALKGTKP